MAFLRPVLSLLGLLVIFFQVMGHKPVFKTYKNKKLGEMNVTFAFQNKDNLTTLDKQHILDMHNVLRIILASGKETNSSDGRGGKMRMPTAANMQPVDWDDELAAYAQAYASTCSEGHSDLSQFKSARFKGSSVAENLSGDITYLEKDMYGEVRWWNYENFKCDDGFQCGHYLQFVGWAMNHVGCGWKVCPRVGYTKLLLVCLYAGYLSTAKEEGKKRAPYQHEYLKGTPCSACSQGWDYCMGGALCATKKQCDSDPHNKCECLHDEIKCFMNGGTFSPTQCTCTCPAGKMGINCAQTCANEIDDVCGLTCSGEVSNMYFCQKSCGGCGKAYSAAYKYWYVDRPQNNKFGIKVRHVFDDPDEEAKKTDLTKKAMHGTCKNKANDAICEILFARGYCKGFTYGPTVMKNCGLSCGECPKKKAKSKTKTKTETIDLSGFKPVGGGSGIDLSGFKTADGSSVDLSGFKTVDSGTSTSESTSTSSGSKPISSGSKSAEVKAMESVAGVDLTGYSIVSRRR